MVKEIVRDIFFLAQKSEPATKADIQVGIDLQDTLKANRDRCVGLAANMIGVKKNIIIVFAPCGSLYESCRCIPDIRICRLFKRGRFLGNDGYGKSCRR